MGVPGDREGSRVNRLNGLNEVQLVLDPSYLPFSFLYP